MMAIEGGIGASTVPDAQSGTIDSVDQPPSALPMMQPGLMRAVNW
jgi:hypothetical protein